LEPKGYVEIEDELYRKAEAFYKDKEKAIGSDLLRHLERMVFLQIIDAKWKDHLYAMDSLREGIGLRAYGQRDPLVEYKREAFGMFSEMIAGIEDDSTEAIFKLQAKAPERFRGAFSALAKEEVHPEAEKFQGSSDEKVVMHDPIQSSHPKVGRNDPCPCGSGKKYKKCCGR